MARKKKKAARKQRVQQRRAKITKKRKVAHSTKPSLPKFKQGEQELFNDMKPLVGRLSFGSDDNLEGLLEVLYETSDFIEEPEFEDLIIPPSDSLLEFTKAAEAVGLGPSSVDEMDDDDFADEKWVDVNTTAITKLLTKSVRQEILDSLNALRFRLKKLRKSKKDVARAAVAISFLQDRQNKEIWPVIGIVDAVFRRSLNVGFTLMKMSGEIEYSADDSDDTSPLSIREKLNQSNFAQKASSLVSNIPGLSNFAEKQADKMWEDGMDAIFDGDLYLGLFNEDELEGGAVIVKDVFSNIFNDDLPPKDRPKPNKTRVTEMIEQINVQITDFMTSTRVAEMKAQVKQIIEDKDTFKDWGSFLLMFYTFLEDDDILTEDMPTFTRIYFGELRTVSAMLAEE